MLYQDRIIPIEAIYCPRIVARWNALAPDEEALQRWRLRHSLETLGLLHNVLVVPTPGERYALIAGRRRYEEARALGWEYLSAKIISGAPSPWRLFALFCAENLERRPLDARARVIGLNAMALTRELLSVEDRSDLEPRLVPLAPIGGLGRDEADD